MNRHSRKSIMRDCRTTAQQRFKLSMKMGSNSLTKIVLPKTTSILVEGSPKIIIPVSPLCGKTYATLKSTMELKRMETAPQMALEANWESSHSRRLKLLKQYERMENYHSILKRWSQRSNSLL